ncbi:MAG: 5'/3'-nucleotidase SurE, partial [Gammaproteobacteria bacterium]|nr:5'/3'-nucleotidase SurE [Gammaproteobacteria bacterium]
GRAESIIQQNDPYGNPVYWVGRAGEPEDAALDTDFGAVEKGYISVTPLQIDMTRYLGLEPLQQWLDELN